MDDTSKSDNHTDDEKEEEKPSIDTDQSELLVLKPKVKNMESDDESSSSEYDFYKNVTVKQKDAALKHHECFVCQKRLTSFAAFKRHVMAHAKTKRFECHQCPKSFTEGRFLENHLQIHAKETETCKICLKNSANSKRSRSGDMKIDTGDKLYVCDICKKSFSKKRYLEEHLKMHIARALGKTHGCQVCSKNFASSRTLLGHMRIHTGEKRYQCEICGKAFTESSTRTKHMATHSMINPFQCHLCLQTFSRQSNLNRHLEMHANAKDRESPFKCNLCLKTFTRKANLNKHLDAHARGNVNENSKESLKNVTGDLNRSVSESVTDKGSNERYTCAICGAIYCQYNTLQTHMLKHSEKQEVRCNVCSKEFRNSIYLKQHMKTHNKKFCCDLCERTFSHGYMLRQQLNTHCKKKEKNFLCELCSTSFTGSAALRQHMQRHTGLKSHVCGTCSQAFYTKSELRKHENVHERKTKTTNDINTANETTSTQYHINSSKEILQRYGTLTGFLGHTTI